MKFPILISLFFFVWAVITVQTNKAEDGATSNGGDENRKKMVKAFYSIEGIRIPDDAATNYSQDVVDKMIEVLHDGNRNVHVGLVNKFIYESELRKVGKTESSIIDYDTMLSAIDLIVPNIATDPMVEFYKSELNKFYKDELALAKELSELIYNQLMDGQLKTRGAMTKLRHFYYHWIALSKLVEFINDNATN